MEIPIIYEDENMMVVEKPAGLLVYLPSPSAAGKEAKEVTLAEILKPKLNFNSASIKNRESFRSSENFTENKEEKKGERRRAEVIERRGIVHRLDRETSGLLLVAKNPKAEEKLKEIFKTREIKKKYLALVWGKLEPERGEINIPLGRGSKDRLRVVPKEEGRESATGYKVIKYFQKSDMSLVEADLKTGRTHQIRVHFGAIGHPVVGDEKYSKRKTKLKRQFLHAAELEFINPFNKKKMYFKSDLPRDLKEYLNRLD